MAAVLGPWLAVASGYQAESTPAPPDALASLSATEDTIARVRAGLAKLEAGGASPASEDVTDLRDELGEILSNAPGRPEPLPMGSGDAASGAPADDIARAATESVIDALDRLQGRWIQWLSSAPEDALPDQLFAQEVQRRLWFTARYRSAHDVLHAVDASTLSRALRFGEPSVAAWIESVRADSLRVEGRFHDALMSLEQASRRLEKLPSDALNRTMFLSTALKLEIDLGRLDRAREAVRRLEQLALARPDDLTARLASAIGHIRFAHAAGARTTLARRLADLESSVGARAATDTEVAQALSLGRALKAVADARAARSATDQRAALRAVNRALPSARGPTRLSLQLARARLNHELGQDTQPYVDALLGELAEVSSPLGRARAAAEIHAFTRTSNDPSSRVLAASHLRVAAEQSIEAWADLEAGPGGVGFLEHVGRRFVLAELIECELPSDSGAAGALARLLSFDDCHATVRRLRAKRAKAHLTGEGARVPALAAAVEAGGAQLLVLAASERYTDAFVVDGRGRVRHERLAGAKEVENALGPFARRLAQHPKERPNVAEAEEQPARDLGDRLLRVLNRAPNDRRPLWVVGWEPRPFVPLACIPASQGEALGLRFPILHTASCTELVWSSAHSEASPARARGATVLLSLEGDDQRGRIGLSNREVRAIQIAAGAKFRHLAGRSATPTRFREALASGADLIALWTHGDFDATSRFPAQILLEHSSQRRSVRADDTRMPSQATLNAGDLESALSGVPIQRVPRVVFLATCGADRGHRRAGDPLAGRTTGVLLANGVRAVVAAQGALHRDATQALLQEFVKQHRSLGAPPVSALFEARRAVARTAGFEDPHFWGPLSLYGR